MKFTDMLVDLFKTMLCIGVVSFGIMFGMKGLELFFDWLRSL